jgi:ParB family chromosome partitioning protein
MSRKTLGRGLDALIPTRPPDTAVTTPLSDGLEDRMGRAGAGAGAAVGSAAAHEVAIERIRPNRFQPRDHFDSTKLEELAESMRENGVLQPLIVSPRGDEFELVAGERRLRAARLAGLTHVPVVVRDVDDREALKLALLENIQREDLNPVEEARGYQRLIDDFDMTQLELGERLGKSRTAIANALRLLQLPADLQSRIQSGDITAGHARALLAAPTLAEQQELASIVRERGLSVREVEALANQRRGKPAPRKPAAVVAPNPALQELARRLEQRLGTRVRIQARKSDGSSGRIEIEYYSAAELERIFEAAGVPYLL